MRQHLIGLAAVMAVAVASAPAMAGCGGCAPAASYSGCVQPSGVGCGGYGGAYGFNGLGFNGGYGYAGGYGYSTVPAPAQYYAVQPQYYYVDQGPTFTGPGMFAPAASYQQRAVAGWSGYGGGYYGYDGGPYANPSHHYYHGMPAATSPTIYSYRRAYGPRYGYARPYAPRYGYGARVYGPRGYGSRMYRAPSMRYGNRPHMAPRYSGAPQRMMRPYR